jgi:hypothetical protein
VRTLARRSALLLTAAPAGGRSVVRLDEDNERRPITVIVRGVTAALSRAQSRTRSDRVGAEPVSAHTMTYPPLASGELEAWWSDDWNTVRERGREAR